MAFLRRSTLTALAALYFGDGSDGDVTVSTAITLTRDWFYNNLTLAPGGSINTAGYRIFVKDTCDVSNADTNAINCNGVNGTDASATPNTTTAVPTASYVSFFWTSILNSPGTGGAGGTSAGVVGGGTGSATGTYLGGKDPGDAGGAGGTSGANAGGARGTWTPTTRAQPRLRYPTLTAGSSNSAVSCGGGGGAGDNTAGAGNGGGNGGAGAYGGGGVFLAARRIKRSSSNPNTGIISAKSGRGGNGSSPTGGNRSGGGGAPGAAGGSIYLLFAELLGSVHANALDVSGGAGGNGGTKTGTGTDGQGGQAGWGGFVYLINVSTGTSSVIDRTSLGGNANSGVTGGTSTPARCDL